MTKVTLFTDVVLPTAAGNWFTYRVPQHLNNLVEFGKRVLVPFGKNKLYAGIIVNIHQSPPKNYEAKYIEEVIDSRPIITAKQFELWKWMANYYLCFAGEVMNAAVPGGLKLNSETKIILHPNFKNPENLSDREFLIYEALELKKTLSIEDLSKILDIKNVQPIIHQLLNKQVIITEEDVKERYKPRFETYVKLNDKLKSNENLKSLFNSLKKKPKQEELLTAYLMLSAHYSANPRHVLKKELLEKCPGSLSVLKTLEKKEILISFKQEVGRTILKDGRHELLCILNNEQQEALNEIKKAFNHQKHVLLNGVTGSGKTEIYFHLIDKVVKEGKQVLYLLPEIALTYQMINRLKKHFGNAIGVYHSRYSENERVEIWNRCLIANENRLKIILGARSSIFLPFTNLGLIIVDEEHDTSFKQQDPAPRYNARDLAYVLAQHHNAHLILGSATPSMESFYNSQLGKTQIVNLNTRYGKLSLPKVNLVDLKEARLKKNMHSLFSKTLLDEIKIAIENNQQVILFQNRRGFSRYIECSVCAEVPYCLNCDVSLTYHKSTHNLKCHYCGYSTPVPKVCKKCQSPDLKLQGFGTEKVEEELALFFPEAKIGRMDLDSTRSKNAYQKIITDFEENKLNVLIGTQMVTKGLNFDNVGLVGVLDADQLLHFPDFRAFEKAYQVLTQVAGRSGRKENQGKVIIQTANPNHPIFKFINQNAEPFYLQQLEERKNFNYPPFTRLIQITIKHKKKENVVLSANNLACNLKKQLGNLVLGPEFPVIERLFDLYQMQILLKINRSLSIKKVQNFVQSQIIEFKLNPQNKGCKVVLNVDPL